MLRQADGQVFFTHARAPYDPKKAHEYYMRTRKLKGRKPGQQMETGANLPPKKGTYSVKLRNGQTAKLSAQQLTEQRLYAEARIASIQKKLVELNKKLKDKLAEARKAEAEAKKPKSAADKAKAARDAKKYRDKNQQKLKNARKKAASKEQSKPKADPVKELQGKIEDVKKSLDAAVARQRALASATKTG